MDILQLLTSRRSQKNLIAPAPNQEQIEMMLQAATQVPDHGGLCPFRFVVIRQEAMAKFERALLRAASELGMGEEGENKARRLGGEYAPLMIAVISDYKQAGGKVPKWEQLATASCSAYAIQLAAKAQGFDSVWISGKWVEAESVRRAFSCEGDNQIVAFLMIGSALHSLDEAKNTQLERFVEFW